MYLLIGHYIPEKNGWIWLVERLTWLGRRQHWDDTDKDTEASVDSNEDLVLLTPGGETVVEEEKEGAHGRPNEEHTGVEVQPYNRRC